MESAFALLRNLAAHSAIFVLGRGGGVRRTQICWCAAGAVCTPQLRNAGRCACSYKVLAARLEPCVACRVRVENSTSRKRANSKARGFKPDA